MTQKIRIAGIVNDSITDGPGLRLAIFTQGCLHCCEGCHNQHSWDVNGGYEISIEELKQKVLNNPLLSGVTLSGGEPMLQAKVLLPFAQFLKENNIDLIIYSGYTFEEVIANSDFKKLLEYASILVDGKFEINNRSLELKFKGSSNQRVINIQKSLESNRVVLKTDDKWV